MLLFSLLLYIFLLQPPPYVPNACFRGGEGFLFHRFYTKSKMCVCWGKKTTTTEPHQITFYKTLLIFLPNITYKKWFLLLPGKKSFFFFEEIYLLILFHQQKGGGFARRQAYGGGGSQKLSPGDLFSNPSNKSSEKPSPPPLISPWGIVLLFRFHLQLILTPHR